MTNGNISGGQGSNSAIDKYNSLAMFGNKTCLYDENKKYFAVPYDSLVNIEESFQNYLLRL